MDYKNKYNEALARAITAYKDGDKHVKNIIETIFPEIKETEDDNIREKFEKWVAWVEKQGGKKLTLKSSNSDDVRRLMKQIMKEAEAYELNLPNRSYDIYAFAKDILAWIEKQDEQKSSDDENADITQKDFTPKIEPYIGGKFLA